MLRRSRAARCAVATPSLRSGAHCQVVAIGSLSVTGRRRAANSGDLPGRSGGCEGFSARRAVPSSQREPKGGAFAFLWITYPSPTPSPRVAHTISPSAPPSRCNPYPRLAFGSGPGFPARGHSLCGYLIGSAPWGQRLCHPAPCWSQHRHHSNRRWPRSPQGGAISVPPCTSWASTRARPRPLHSAQRWRELIV